jgi:diacylglycerol kinase family enzyme
LRGFLLINPRAGTGRPDAAELLEAAEKRGLQAHVLGGGDDAVALARAADAEAIGVAGGDGSLAPVAAVAVERDLPFVCVPFGTRNHFARDLGLDRGDAVAALEAFDGRERRIDVGRVGGRLFLNNVSLGAYASLVHRRERHRRRRRMLARMRALWLTARDRHELQLSLDGRGVEARILLVANNAYELQLFDVGARETLTEGRLHVYTARGWLPNAWEETTAEAFTLTCARPRLRAAVDGEPAVLEPPIEFSIEHEALRVLVPQAPRR